MMYMRRTERDVCAKCNYGGCPFQMKNNCVWWTLNYLENAIEDGKLIFLDDSLSEIIRIIWRNEFKQSNATNKENKDE